jgi:hypothetical protein
MASMFPREDGGIAFVSSPRAAGVTAHVQKPSLPPSTYPMSVAHSSGCVWALGRLGLQCCSIACASKQARVSVWSRRVSDIAFVEKSSAKGRTHGRFEPFGVG